jgi:predicted DNA-binding protein YlxM (UPF0122 family)
MENKEEYIYTYQELADKYKVSKRTIYNWITPIKKELLAMNRNSQKRFRTFTRKQIKYIEEYLG